MFEADLTCRNCHRPTDHLGPTGCCRACADRAEALCRAHAALIWEMAPLAPPGALSTCARCSTPCPIETVARVTPSIHLCPDCRARNDLIARGFVPALIEKAQQMADDTRREG